MASNRCETFWATLKAKRAAEKKQDRQGVRTPANIEQKYNIEKVKTSADEAKSSAEKSLLIVSKIEEGQDGIALQVAGLKEDLNGVYAELELTIRTDENGVVHSAIGATADTIQFNSNTLIINSTYFSLSADGVATAKDINITGGTLDIPLESGYHLRAGSNYSGLRVDSADFVFGVSGESTQITPSGIHYYRGNQSIPVIRFGGEPYTLYGEWEVNGDFQVYGDFTIGSTTITESQLAYLIAIADQKG